MKKNRFRIRIMSQLQTKRTFRHGRKDASAYPMTGDVSDCQGEPPIRQRDDVKIVSPHFPGRKRGAIDGTARGFEWHSGQKRLLNSLSDAHFRLQA